MAGASREHQNLPEYESLAALGAYTGIGNIELLLKANQLCTDFTLDTVSTGAAIAFAMDCFEKGFITMQHTGGLELRFGNDDVMLTLIESIAYREGIGKILAEGVSRAALIWGNDTSAGGLI